LAWLYTDADQAGDNSADQYADPNEYSHYAADQRADAEVDPVARTIQVADDHVPAASAVELTSAAAGNRQSAGGSSTLDKLPVIPRPEAWASTWDRARVPSCVAECPGTAAPQCSSSGVRPDGLLPGNTYVQVQSMRSNYLLAMELHPERVRLRYRGAHAGKWPAGWQNDAEFGRHVRVDDYIPAST
jgi:hypothetical protein